MQMRRIQIRVGKTAARAQLFEDQAPATVGALLNVLPIRDRTIQTRWSGSAWRTEGNYELLPAGSAVENVAGRLTAGDIIYYPGYESGLVKIGVAYGPAQWLAPFMQPIDVSLVGKIESNLEEFVKTCERILLEGPLDVEITRVT